MKLHKLNGRYLVCCLFLLSVLILAGRVIYMLVQGQVSDHGKEMSSFITVIIIAVIALPVSTYVYSFIIMLKQYIKHKGNAYTLTQNGIENTLTFINLFAFIFVLPVKKIPWEAIKVIDNSEGFYQIRVSIKMIEASLLAKGIMFIRGYNFCYKFSSPYITNEEIGVHYNSTL